MDTDEVIKQQLEESRDSRRYKDKFHYNWAILSGATLSIAINFIKDFQNLNVINLLIIKFSLIFIACSLILPLLRNFISAYLTGKSLHINSLTISWSEPPS